MANGVSRVGRKEQLLAIVTDNPGISTRQLAKLMGMAYGTHFRQLVLEAYDTGYIWHCEGKEIAGRKTNHWYPPLWTE